MPNKKYPFVDMKPGESVFLPGELYGGSAHAAVRTTQRRMGWTFEVRAMDDDGITVWRTDGADVFVPGKPAKIGRPSVYGFDSITAGCGLYFPCEVTGGEVYNAARAFARRRGIKVSGRDTGLGLSIQRVDA